MAKRYYTIDVLGGNKVPLIFGTWTLKRFCELNGNMTLMELQDALGIGMTFSLFSSLLLCAAEAACIKEKREFNYTDVDATDWIDDMGGIASKSFADLINNVTQSLNHHAGK